MKMAMTSNGNVLRGISAEPFGIGYRETQPRIPFVDEAERCYKETIRQPLSQAKEMGETDVVVGIPFYNEVDTLPQVLKIAAEGLERLHPNERKCLVIAVGSPAGREALEAANATYLGDNVKKIIFLLQDEKISGKGWSLRAIMEVAQNLGADLAILEADLESQIENGEIIGLAPDWVESLLKPIREGEMDLVISRFNRHYFETPISDHLAYPLMAAIYGIRNYHVRDVVRGELGISHRLLSIYLKYPHLWSNNIGRYGIDIWLITTALTEGARICEANLGVKLHKPSAGKTEIVLRQIVQVLFERIVADREWWKKREGGVLQTLSSFGIKEFHQPREVRISHQDLMVKFKQGFNKFCTLYEKIFPLETCQELRRLAGSDLREFDFSIELWTQVVYHSLLAFAFNNEFAKGDILNSIIPLYNGREASFVWNLQVLRDRLGSLEEGEAEHFVSLEAERQVEEQGDEFFRQRSDFTAKWEREERALRPPVPRVTYREFIPGVPLVVPSEITSSQGDVVRANDIYKLIFDRYKEEFEEFVYKKLKTPHEADSCEIARRIRDFLRQVEGGLSEVFLSGNLSIEKGTRALVESLWNYFPHKGTFALNHEVTLWLLRANPPSNLLTKMNCEDLDSLLQKYEPNDILALASWSEEREYTEKIQEWIKENVRSEHFSNMDLKAVVVNHEKFPSLAEMKESSELNRLTGRVIVSNLRKGMGGEFPKLRYFTTIAKNIIEAERFGEVWQSFAEERREFGRMVVNSLIGHWARTPLSAHNIFENGNQRMLVNRVREMARGIALEADEDSARLNLSRHLEDLADSYHLFLTLPDGKFIPCSAWTWASYSFKGGKEIPTPLSLHVERDWVSREFLVEYFRAGGGSEEEVDEKIVELMGQGREWENLVPILFKTEKETDEVTKQIMISEEYPPSRRLARFSGNPILEPIKEHSWESKYVLNAGAIRIKEKVYIVYRAVGEDGISRLGLAVSGDGFEIQERLKEPIFEPKGGGEEKGCEDPRLTLINGSIYMLYTAYSSIVAQIALASIKVEDFLNRRWESWQRHGLVFPDFSNKDAALFPERFNGKYAMLHRAEQHIWISFSPQLCYSQAEGEHTILAGPGVGMVWDSMKIGAGTQPIKTRYGWLIIYHGVDNANIYRLGSILLDIADPTKLVYRSPNCILEPEEVYEVGEKGKSWVPNVVFTCGAVPKLDKEILDAEDEILVYYGAADTVICVATAKVGDLVPSISSSCGKVF